MLDEGSNALTPVQRLTRERLSLNPATLRDPIGFDEEIEVAVEFMLFNHARPNARLPTGVPGRRMDCSLQIGGKGEARQADGSSRCGAICLLR